MLIEAQKIIGLPIASLAEQAKIGEIKVVFVDLETAIVLGFGVRQGYFSKRKVVSLLDVKEWDPNGMVINSEEDLVLPEEIIRIQQIISNNDYLIGKIAETESGKKLGQVINFLIETETGAVTKFYLEDLLGNARIFPKEKVVRIDKTIVFTDDEGEVKSGAIETQIA
jgi:uncharacterized protein YrrD